MVGPLLRPSTVSRLKNLRARGFATIREFHDDAYTVWKLNRASNWEDGTSVDGATSIESGTGKLYSNGAGRPQGVEGMIHLESPYRFRCLATAQIESGNLLVLNGARLFRVDIGKPEDVDDDLMDVFLSELFNTPMPEVTP